MLENLASIPPSFYTRDGKRLSLLSYAFLLMLCVAFFTPGMVTMPPTDRDESSFAQASKQMIETGDYTDIRLQKEPRYKKPIGIYWLQSAAVRAFDPHHLNEIWAYRLPSFAGATVSVLMTAALGSLLFGPTAGLLAAMMLSGCVLLNVEARLAKTDAMLLACIMVAIYAMARAYLGRAAGWAMPFLFWTAFAGGVLIKGPIILLPVSAVLLWTRITDKNIQWFRALRPALGVIYALALIAPWFVAISLQSHGAFMQQSAGHDFLAKLWQGQNRGLMPPGLHLMALPLAFFPFALFVVFAAPDAWKNRRDPAVKFCLAWIVPTWIVFELSLTKLPHYVLPTYPALALLAAKFLCDGFPSLAAATKRVPVVLTVGVWLFVGIGYAVVFSLLPQFSDQVWLWPQIGASIVIILAQGAALLYLPHRKVASVIVLTIGGMIFMTAVFGDTLPRLQHIWLSRKIDDAAMQVRHCPGEIVAVGYHEPSLVFLAGTDTILAADGTTAANALKEDACRIVAIDTKHQQEFLDAFKDGTPPMQAATIDGLNSGHGAKTALTLYTTAP